MLISCASQKFLLRCSVEEINNDSSGLCLCRREEKSEAKKSAHTTDLEASVATYDAKSDPNAVGTDAMRTLFVSRLDYSTTETDLYAEFEKHGAIRQLKLIKSPEGKSRGYDSLPYEYNCRLLRRYILQLGFTSIVISCKIRSIQSLPALLCGLVAFTAVNWSVSVV